MSAATADCAAWPDAPRFAPLAVIVCRVDPVVSIGDFARGERRYVALRGGDVLGPRLRGRVLDGGVDWQWRRPDGGLEISAHYALELDDGARVEVRSDGLRHGPPDVMAALARGDAVPRDAYVFRTFVRLHTAAARWDDLNRVFAVAVGERRSDAVRLHLFEIV